MHSEIGYWNIKMVITAYVFSFSEVFSNGLAFMSRYIVVKSFNFGLPCLSSRVLVGVNLTLQKNSQTKVRGC